MLLRIGGGIGRHLLIALSRHSEREHFGGLCGFLLVSCNLVGACYHEVVKPKRVVLRIVLMCIEGSTCMLPSFPPSSVLG